MKSTSSVVQDVLAVAEIIEDEVPPKGDRKRPRSPSQPPPVPQETTNHCSFDLEALTLRVC